jgi:hypothetical protein
MLYPELFKQLEAVRWDMDKDIPWDKFDASQLTDEQAQTIKMNAITEWSALPATEMFLRDNRDDSDFSAFMSIWFFEEQKHSLVLMEYLQALPPRPGAHRKRAARGALRVRAGAGAGDADAAFLRRDPPEPLVPPRQPSGTPSPSSSRSTPTLSQDEARHGGAYLRYMKRAINKFGDEAKAAFAKVGVLMASARRTAQALHPTNLHVNKSCSRATPSRAACPTPSGWSTGWTRRSSSTRSGRTRWSSASCTT